MNPEPTRTPREQTEMRLTALLMGELSAEETVALHAQIAADPGLAHLHARLRQAMELLREATAEPEPATPTPAQLSSERRERLLAHFKSPAPQPAKPAPIVKAPRRVWTWVVPLGAAAAVVVILAGLLFPAMSGVKQSARKSAQAVRSLDELRIVDSGIDQYAIEGRGEAQNSSTIAATALGAVMGQIRETNGDFAGKDTSVVGASPVTAGNRSGSEAISASAIDALLFGKADPAPVDRVSKKSGASALYLPPTTDAPADLASVSPSKKAEWGNLPPKLAEDLSRGQAAAGNDESVQAYYRAVAEKSKAGQIAEQQAKAKNDPSLDGGVSYGPSGTTRQHPDLDNALVGQETLAAAAARPAESPKPDASALPVLGDIPVAGKLSTNSAGTPAPSGAKEFQRYPGTHASNTALDPGVANVYNGVTVTNSDSLSLDRSANEMVKAAPVQDFAKNLSSDGVKVPNDGARLAADGDERPLQNRLGDSARGTTKSVEKGQILQGRVGPVVEPALPAADFDGSVNFGSAIAKAPAAPSAPGIRSDSDAIVAASALAEAQLPKGEREKAFDSKKAAPQEQVDLSGKDAGRFAGLTGPPASSDKSREITAKNVEIRQSNQAEISLGFGWVDDEASKLNRNAATEGTHSDEDDKRRPAIKTDGADEQVFESVDEFKFVPERAAKDAAKAQEQTDKAAAGEDPFGNTGELRDAQPAPVPAPLKTQPPPLPALEPALPERQQAAAEKREELKKEESAVQPRKPEMQLDEPKELAPEGRDENGRKGKKDLPSALDALVFQTEAKTEPVEATETRPAEQAAATTARPALNAAAPKIAPATTGDLAQEKLAEAQSYFESDRLDLAFKRAEQVLSIDPHNEQAQRLEDRINMEKQDFDSRSYTEKRARAPQKADNAWANPVRKFNVPQATPAPATEQLQWAAKTLGETSIRELNEQRNRVSALEQQEKILEKLKPEELPQALRSMALEDYSATRASRTVGELSVEEKRLLNSGLGADHPSVKEVREKLASAQSDAENTMKATRDRLAQASALEAKRLAVMEQQAIAKLERMAEQPAKAAAVQEEVKKLDEVIPAARPAQPAAIPQPEVATSANAFSTFSLNVSDVSFKLAGASLEKGQMPELATVRSEEFINAFDYRDPEPAAGAPLAFATERARYPFAQNRDLVRFSVKTAAAGRQPGRPLNLVLLLDNSGSMERADRVRILREALRVLAAQLQPQDRLSVVAFARTPRIWADGVTGDKAGAAVARVGEITPQGGTNLEAALDLGYATALRHYQPGSISRVVLLTDGAANLGDVNPDALKRKVETNRQRGVALDCFGIGWEGYDDTLLETLARNGDGRYGFINTPEEAASGFAAQLAGALRVAASDVKVQVEWNPRRVTAYRQIGYAKHQLKKEQFRDNTVDAAEIGAAESGNALYVVEVNPRGEGDLARVRVRFKVPGTADYKEHEWAVSFTKDAPSLEQASPALRLAGTASAFSEWLVASPYAAEVTTDRLLGLLNGVPAIYPADPRPKKLEWMIRTAKSVSGR
ncbi:MAG: von Willebrand factor type A domain-containing protein [Chthoniobacter sp.]|nr:von Willebrand factor type A domain-containing protein [Chthoniobacter sp.]